MSRLHRLAAIAAVFGGLGQIAATAAEPNLSEDPPAAMAVLAGNSGWQANRVLDLLTFLLVVFALAVFARTVGEPGPAWTQPAVVFLAALAALGCAAGLAQLSLHVVADGWAGAAPDIKIADEAVYRAVNEITYNLYAGAFLTYGAFLGLLGAAILAGRDRPRWIGWAMYAAALCLVVGTLAMIATAAAFLVVLAGLGLVDVLLVAVGFLLWPRRPSLPSTPALTESSARP